MYDAITMVPQKERKAFCNLCIPLLFFFLAYEEYEGEGKISNNKQTNN